MCGFTCITYSECAHTALSTKPDHTLLCSNAKEIYLIQGLDCAPADCVPTDDTETRIAAENIIFDYCDECWTVVHAAKLIERGEMDDILQAHAHAKEEDQGNYDEDETEQLRSLATYLNEKHAAGLEAIQQLKALPSNLSTLALTTDSELRALLCAPDVEKHFVTFKYCSELFPVMGSYIQQCAPNKLFAETFVYPSERAKEATAMLEYFQIVLDCLINYEPPQPEEHFNGSEARLEFFGNTLQCIITGRDPDVPPTAFHFHKNSFVVPEATLQQLEAVQDVPQARNEEQQRGSERKPSRKARGMLNIYHLAFHPESMKGLLDDEPSRNFEAVHVAFPEDENAIGIDVKDKQHNKLVWRDGKSHITLAVVEAKDQDAVNETVERPTKSTAELQTELTKIPHQPTGGFGFDYSDDEDDTLVHTEVDETKAIVDKSHNISSDLSPYLGIPSSPPISAAEDRLQSHPPSSSFPSSPSLPTLPHNHREAKTSKPNSGPSSPSSRKRKALSSDTHEDTKSVSSDEEEDEEKNHSDPPVERNCRNSLSSDISSSRSTRPVEAKVRISPSAPPSPLAVLRPLSSPPASTDSSSLSSAPPSADSVLLSQQPPAPLPPQPTPPQRRMQTRAMARDASTAAKPVAPAPTKERR